MIFCQLFYPHNPQIILLPDYHHHPPPHFLYQHYYFFYFIIATSATLDFFSITYFQHFTTFAIYLFLLSEIYFTFEFFPH